MYYLSPMFNFSTVDDCRHIAPIAKIFQNEVNIHVVMFKVKNPFYKNYKN